MAVGGEVRKLLGLLLLLLLGLLLGCSPHPNRTIVEEAIQWQIHHPTGIRQELVGSQTLGSRIRVTGVRVKRDQRWQGEVFDRGQSRLVKGRLVSGSYRIRLGREKRVLPFSLVLVPDPPDWFLALREGESWRLQPLQSLVPPPEPEETA